MLKKLLLLLISIIGPEDRYLQAQGERWMHPGEILWGIEKLNKLGSVLYIAAHPDDENTRVLSWLSKDQKLRTAYLSLTRGEGGQNLIGGEKGEMLGLIRTHELLEARKIDGAQQFFYPGSGFRILQKSGRNIE
jgi:LmbE family N-acetylglucosaminyl deacetylase